MTAVRSDPVAHGWVQRGALALHHLRWDGGNARPVVCLHGVTGHAWAWNGVAALLSERSTVYALDLRGHGASSWAADGDYATASLAADVAAVVECLDLGAVDVVGLSWGGLVGATLAATRPELVARLVMVDVPPSFDQAPDEVPDRPGCFADLGEVVAFERSLNRFAPDHDLAVLAAGSVRPGPTGLERCHDPRFLAEWPFRAEDHWPAVRAVSCPTLVVRARDSFVLDRGVAEAEAEVLGAELVEIGPSGHLVPVDAPGAFTEIVVGFLGSGSPR